MSDFATLILKLQNMEFNNAIQQSSVMLESFSKKTAKIGAALTGLSIPLGIFAKSAITGLASFDDAMTKSLSIMSGVSEELRTQMEMTAKQLSTELPLSSKEAADSLFFLASAGLSAEESLKALPIVAKFATAGAFDMATATDLLTDAQSALGLAVDDTAKNMQNMIMLSDLFVKGNTLANTSVQQLSEAITNEAGAAMSKFNIDLKDGIATLAAFADQGIKGNVAGSMFGRAIRLLSKAALENSEQFDKLGISIFNANGDMNSFADIAEDMEIAFNGLSVEQKIATLQQLGFNARVQQAILPLIGASKQIRKYSAELEKAGGITDKVANKQIKSFGVQLQLLMNTFNNFSMELASTFEPEMRALVDNLKETIQWFRSLDPTVKKIMAGMVAFGAVIGPVVLAIAGISYAMSIMIPIAGTLLTTIGAIAVSFKFLDGFIAQLEKSGIIDIFKNAITDVTGLNFNINDLIDNIKVIGIAIEGAGRIWAQMFISAGEAIGGLGLNIFNFVNTLKTYLSDNWIVILDNMLNLATSFGRDISNLFSGIGENIIKALTGKETDFTRVFANVGKELERAVAKTNIPQLKAQNPFNVVIEAMDEFIDKIDEINEDVGNKITETLQKSVIDSLEKAVETGKKLKEAVGESGASGVVGSDGANGGASSSKVASALLAGTAEAQKVAIGTTVDSNKQTALNTKDIAKNTKDQTKLMGDLVSNSAIWANMEMGNIGT